MNIDDSTMKRYFDMLVYQSRSNEQKAGSSADSVADKLEVLLSQILQEHIIVKRLEAELFKIHNGNPDKVNNQTVQILRSILGLTNNV